MLTENNKESVLLAKMVGVHGVKGLIKIKTFTEGVEIFKQNIKFYNQYNDNIDIKISFVKNNIIVAQVDDISDRNEAQKMVGQEIYIARSDLPPENDDEIYFIDLIGMELITQDKISVGVVKDIYNFGAGDILEYESTDKKLHMICYNEKFIQDIDKDLKKITINIPFMI